MEEAAAGAAAGLPLCIIVEAEAIGNEKDTHDDMDTDAIKAEHGMDDGEAMEFQTQKNYPFPQEPYPESFSSLSKLTISIGPVTLLDLGSGELTKILNTGCSFEFKFETAKKREAERRYRQKKEKLGYVRIPFLCRTPSFLLHVTSQLCDMKIGERETSLTFPNHFNGALAEIKAYVERNKKLRFEHSLALQKKRLFIRKIPEDLTLVRLQAMFPEAKSHLIRFRKSGTAEGKPFDVRMDFETEEDTNDFFNNKKDDLKIDDQAVTLHYPYLANLEKEERKKNQPENTANPKETVKAVKKEPVPKEPPIDSVTLQKRRLLLKSVPDDITVEKVQSLFPQAKKHHVRRRKDKPCDVRLEFDSEEAAQSFFDKKKNSIKIDGQSAVLSYPYQEHLPKKKKTPAELALANEPSKNTATKGQEKRKLPGLLKSEKSFSTAKQPRLGSGSYSRNASGMAGQMQQQRRMQELQMRQRMMLQQSSNLSNIGMGGVSFGASNMNQGQGWMNNNYQSGYGNSGFSGNSYNQNQSQSSGDDPMSMMASLKSTLDNIEKKILMSDGDGNRKGGKRQGNYGGGGVSYSQNTFGGGGSGQNQLTRSRGSSYSQNYQNSGSGNYW